MPQLLVRVRFGVRVRDRVRGRVRDRGRNWLRMGTSCVTPGRRVAGPTLTLTLTLTSCVTPGRRVAGPTLTLALTLTSCVTPGRRVAGPSRRALSPDCRLSALGAGEGLG